MDKKQIIAHDSLKIEYVKIRGLHYPVRIHSLIGIGSSMLVYKASVNGEPCILKELYPRGFSELKLLRRCCGCSVKVRYSPNVVFAWLKARKRCMSAARLNMSFQDMPGLCRYVVPIYGIYRCNGTIYVLQYNSVGIPLNEAFDADISVSDVIIAIVQIARMTDAVHKAGWLMVDIKASNYIVNKDDYGKIEVWMIDFDSAVRLKEIHNQKRFMCSTETASPELISCNQKNVGFHSDVYSIAKMLLTALSKHSIADDDICRLFEYSVCPKLVGWSDYSVQMLKDILVYALEINPINRMPSCGQLAESLYNICKEENIIV